MAYSITLITGDGTGPELAEVAREVIDATGVAIEWDVQEAGVHIAEKTGNPLTDETIASIKKNKVALKAPITTPVGKGFRSVNVTLRQVFDCYANIRPAKYYAGVQSRYEGVDLVVFRENIEDLYAGIEFEQGDEKTQKLIADLSALSGKDIREDSAISIKPISTFRTERIVRAAFEYARREGRKKVTAVHKANIMKYTDGLFLRTAERVAGEYSDIAFEDRIVDNMCMQLVQKPEEYDVLVMENLYGDIISDLCSGLVGGLGVAPGANIGDEYAIFEPVHGSAPKYAGQNKVNPTAILLAGAMMLRHIGEKEAGDRLERAVAAVIAEGKEVTYDLKKDRNDPTAVGTREMGQAVIKKMSDIS